MRFRQCFDWNQSSLRAASKLICGFADVCNFQIKCRRLALHHGITSQGLPIVHLTMLECRTRQWGRYKEWNQCPYESSVRWKWCYYWERIKESRTGHWTWDIRYWCWTIWAMYWTLYAGPHRTAREQPVSFMRPACYATPRWYDIVDVLQTSSPYERFAVNRQGYSLMAHITLNRWLNTNRAA